MNPIRIGVIGAGSMGQLHSRVVANTATTQLVWVSDPSEDSGRRVADRHGAQWLPAPNLSNVDAVIVAAPTEFHYPIACSVMDAGLPLLLEKPLALELAESIALIERARSRGSILMCGLLERFNPAVRTALEICRNPVRVATVRHSPYSPRIRSGVTSDLIIHDADIAIRAFGSEPVFLRACLGAFHPDRSASGSDEPVSEDVAEVVAQFPHGGVASLSASRLSQYKVRTLSLTELGRTIEVDLLRQGITIYKNVESTAFDEDAGYRQQTVIEIPVVRYPGEPLQLQLDHFVELIGGVRDPMAELDTLAAPHRFVSGVLAGAGQP